MPPKVIFKGKRCKPEWIDEAPQNTILRMSDNGWITTNIFMNWGELFLSQLPKNKRTSTLTVIRWPRQSPVQPGLSACNESTHTHTHTPRVEVLFFPHIAHKCWNQLMLLYFVVWRIIEMNKIYSTREKQVAENYQNLSFSPFSHQPGTSQQW